jgi:hypothetical protein
MFESVLALKISESIHIADRVSLFSHGEFGGTNCGKDFVL